jgi:hypothetical protein
MSLTLAQDRANSRHIHGMLGRLAQAIVVIPYGDIDAIGVALSQELSSSVASDAASSAVEAAALEVHSREPTRKEFSQWASFASL